MNAEKINLFLATNADNFPKEAIPMIRERLEHLEPEKEMAVHAVNFTSPVVNLLISIFIGEFGIDRFLIGDIGLGVGKLLLFLCCGSGVIWWFIDLFLIMEATRKHNLEKLMQVL